MDYDNDADIIGPPGSTLCDDGAKPGEGASKRPSFTRK